MFLIAGQIAVDKTLRNALFIDPEDLLLEI